MSFANLKWAVSLLFLLVAAGLGAGVLAQRNQAEKPAAVRPAADRSPRKDLEGLTTLNAKVVAVAADGKSFTLETAPGNRRTGEEPKRSEIRLDEKTEITFNAVGVNGAKPSEGQHAQVWLYKASSDIAFKVIFSGADTTPHVTGKVVAVAPDGKTVTIETPPVRGLEGRKIDVKLTEQTKANYYVGKGTARPTENYQAEAWLVGGPRGDGTVSKIVFIDPTANRDDFIFGGKILAVSADGSTLTLEVPSKNRGERAMKSEIKVTPTTEITFQNVGPDGAKVAEGYYARVWLQEGMPGVAGKLVLVKSVGRAR